MADDSAKNFDIDDPELPKWVKKARAAVGRISL